MKFPRYISVTWANWGSLEMMKSIRKMLTSAMGFAWYIVHAGERTVERCEAIGITDPEKPYAGFLEKMAWWKGWAMVRTGEGLELFINGLAMKLGYNDGEVSGMLVPVVTAPDT